FLIRCCGDATSVRRAALADRYMSFTNRQGPMGPSIASAPRGSTWRDRKAMESSRVRGGPTGSLGHSPLQFAHDVRRTVASVEGERASLYESFELSDKLMRRSLVKARRRVSP